MINNALARAYITGAEINEDALNGVLPPKKQRDSMLPLLTANYCMINKTGEDCFELWVEFKGNTFLYRKYRHLITAKRASWRVNEHIEAGIFNPSSNQKIDGERHYARIMRNGIRRYVGVFATREEAIEAQEHFRGAI